MDSFKFEDVKVEKEDALSRYNKHRRITTLFRLIEICVLIIVVSRIHPCSSLFNLSVEGFRGIISLTLISPRFVFILGNAIVIALLLASGRFSSKNIEEKSNELYDEYVQLSPIKHQVPIKLEEKMKISGRYADRRPAARVEERDRSMRRRKRKSENGRPTEEEMSCEEFRRTVEAFIDRQQRFLREEEEIFAMCCSSLMSAA